jgi:PAS domain S-box-containing protein
VRSLLTARRLSRELETYREVGGAERSSPAAPETEIRLAQLGILNEELRQQQEEMSVQGEELLRQHEEIQKSAAILHSEREKFKAVLEQMPGGVLIVDAGSRNIIFSNRQAQEIWGPLAGAGVSVDEFFSIPSFHAGGRPYQVEDLPLARSLGLGEVVVQEELEGPGEDGQGAVVSVSSAPVRDPQGGIIAAVATFFDVTERRAAQEVIRRAKAEWERTFDAIPDLIAILDKDHRIVRCNRAMAQALGLRPKELVGRTCYEAVHRLTEPPDFCPHSKAVADGKIHTVEVHELGRDFLVTTTPLLDSQGRVEGSVHLARDVTGMKETEQALKTQALVLESMAEGVVVADEDAVIRFTNPAFDAMFGYEREELYGQRITVLNDATPEENDRLGEEIYGQLNTAGAWSAEVRNRKKDGTTFYTSCHLKPLKIGDKQFFVAVQADITERKQAEEALRESQIDLNRAQAVAHTGSWRLDVRCNELRWSDETYRIFGVSRGMPLTYEAFLAAVHPEDKNYVDQKWAAALRGESYDIEHRIVVGDKVKWVRERAELEFDSQGMLLGGFGTVQDITERKKAEEAFRRQAELLDLAHDAIIVRDLKDRIVFWNRGAEETYGWSRQEALGTVYRELLRTEFPQPLEEMEKQLLGTGRWSGELIHHTRDGRRVAVASSWGLHRGEQGQLARILQICTDITARKEAEEALKRAYDQLELRVEERTADLKATVEQLEREVEERLAAEEALRQSEERFAQFLKHLPGPAVIRDARGRYLLVNEAWERIFQMKAADVLGKTVKEVWPPDYASRFQRLDEEVLAGEVLKSVERFPAAEGEVYFLANRFPILDQTGRPVMMGGIGIDITDRQRAEQALRESEERFRVLFETAGGIIILLSPEGHFLELNPEAERFIGWSREEVLGKDALASFVPEEYRGLAEEQMNRLRAGQPVRNFELPIIVRDGRRRVTLWNTNPYYDAKGNLAGVIGVAQDITERQQAEEAVRTERERFLSLLEVLPASIFLQNREHRIIFANRYFREWFGEPEGKRCFEILRGRSERCQVCPVEKVFETGVPQESEWAAPSQRIYQVYAYPFADWDGSPMSLDMYVDITARKQAERDLRESEEKLRFLAGQILRVQERERGNLSRELHEGLGQALLVFKLQLRVILKQIPEEYQELREDCNQALRYIDEIIEDIRHLSYNLSPRALEEIGLAAALQHLCEEFGRLQGLGVSLEMDDLGESLSKESQINIYRIFQEALTNISKHAGATKVKLQVKRRGGEVACSIKDNGQGFNVKEVTTWGHAGRGLGLAAMEERVRNLGGKFQIDSRIGQGTQIWFTAAARKREQ